MVAVEDLLGELAATPDADLLEHRLQVVLDRPRRDVQVRRHLRGGRAGDGTAARSPFATAPAMLAMKLTSALAFALVWAFRDGAAVRVDEHTDTAPLLQALRPAAAAPR